MKERVELAYKAGLLSLATVLLIGIIGSTTMCHYDRNSQQGSRSGKIKFTVEWDSVVVENMRPEKLYFCLYPSNNGAMIKMESASHGINMTLPPDTYQLLVFNNSIEEVTFSNIAAYDSAEVLLMSPEMKENQLCQPIYSAALENIVLESGEQKEVTVKLKSLVQEVNMQIRISNPEAITKCEASLIGVPSSLSLITRNGVVTEKSSVPVCLKKDKNLFAGRCRLLDRALPAPEEAPADTQQLLISVTLRDGQQLFSTLDLQHTLDHCDRQSVLIQVDATVDKTDIPSLILDDWSIRPR